ncbi:hypothetical protein HYALB_00000447 [Hymenoscyphus albidus]|uniref:U4/U6.U5 small nuclear ribonucleoprotein 27kDa protein domain-containing protein n=1 Tax=Hymenoscyphus albidus TaxID=595503 RepID=A0A9N9LKY5_9HELO|nr:hypothetical protein HYALB_00000447 [Hymenoscyphus albidus]
MADSSRRPRRPDSKQMWDELDRRAPIPLPTRERDEPRRDDRRDDKRRYRSRSPRRDHRGGRREARERGGRRDDRDRDGPRDRDKGRDFRGARGGGRRDDDRNRDQDGARERGMYEPAEKILPHRSRSDTVRCEDHGRDSRDKPRERSRDRDWDRRGTRSRSPRRDPRDGRRDADKEVMVEGGGEKSKSVKLEEGDTKSRTTTPPVSFKVGVSGAQDHDRMDMDSGRGKGKSADADLEDDDEIVIEDDGMAAMQAMMGFGGFSTTHNKKVPGNDISAVRKEKKTEYRQYMNRVGGFNRPLSPTRDS